jgi:hypothetical protein
MTALLSRSSSHDSIVIFCPLSTFESTAFPGLRHLFLQVIVVFCPVSSAVLHGECAFGKHPSDELSRQPLPPRIMSLLISVRHPLFMSYADDQVQVLLWPFLSGTSALAALLRLMHLFLQIVIITDSIPRPGRLSHFPVSTFTHG